MPTGLAPKTAVPLPKRQLDVFSATAAATVASLNATFPSPASAVLPEKRQFTSVVSAWSM